MEIACFPIRRGGSKSRELDFSGGIIKKVVPSDLGASKRREVFLRRKVIPATFPDGEEKILPRGVLSSIVIVVLDSCLTLNTSSSILSGGKTEGETRPTVL